MVGGVHGGWRGGDAGVVRGERRRLIAANVDRREALQALPSGVEDIRMSRCHQSEEFGHSPRPAASRTTRPPLASKPTVMCAKCGDPLDGHEMFGECFPEAYLGESPPLVVRNGRLVAV
jgi:hypothetical protein